MEVWRKRKRRGRRNKIKKTIWTPIFYSGAPPLYPPPSPPPIPCSEYFFLIFFYPHFFIGGPPPYRHPPYPLHRVFLFYFFYSPFWPGFFLLPFFGQFGGGKKKKEEEEKEKEKESICWPTVPPPGTMGKNTLEKYQNCYLWDNVVGEPFQSVNNIITNCYLNGLHIIFFCSI